MGLAESNFIKACYGRNEGKIPVWIMRQAGRYLPEYRALLGSEIGSLPMVQSTHSYFVMEEVKDIGMLPLKPVRSSAKR